MRYKHCSKCKKLLPITDFYKDKRRKDGLQFYCKKCQKQRLKDVWANDSEYREKRKQYKRKYYQTLGGRIVLKYVLLFSDILMLFIYLSSLYFISFLKANISRFIFS